MSDNIHAGHRKRMKDEFLEHGFALDTQPHKILELLLFYAIKQTDTNPLAHELLNKYKTLSGVLDAPVNELVQFKGLTYSNVGLLKMIIPISRIYMNEKKTHKPEFSSLDDIGDFLMNEYLGILTEKFSIICMSSSGSMLGFEYLSDGDPASVGVSVRDIAKLAMDCGATGIVMAHNHPSGVAIPSAADIRITKTVATALSHLNIRLVDHVIIGNGDYVSLGQSKEYFDIFK